MKKCIKCGFGHKIVEQCGVPLPPPAIKVDKALLLLRYTREEWLALGFFTRIKLIIFEKLWKEILQIEIK